MLPKCLLSIKGRSCNPTLFVHQDITKKQLITFVLQKYRSRWKKYVIEKMVVHVGLTLVI